VPMHQIKTAFSLLIKIKLVMIFNTKFRIKEK